MSTQVATRTPVQQLVAQIRGADFTEQVALALPDNVTPQRFVRATVTGLMQNPDIAAASPDSIFQAVIRCAQDGLLPDGREAALVVFGQKAVYLPMIAGYRKIAAEYGWSLRTQVVYENDEFDYELGLEPRVTHRPTRLGQERGQPIGAYAVGRHKDGRQEVEVLTAAEIERVRQSSRAKNSGPWVEWADRMWEKTAGRRLFAKLPLGDRDAERVARVIHADELAPGEAAALMYGPPRGILPTGEIVASGGGAGDSVSAAAPLGGDVSAGAADTVAAPDEPEPQLGTPPADDWLASVPAKAVTAAGKTPVTVGDAAGKTIADIADSLEGATWLLWALGRAEDYWPESFRASLDLYVRARHPDIWAAHETAQGMAA